MQIDLTYRFKGRDFNDCPRKDEFEFTGTFAYDLRRYIRGNVSLYTQVDETTDSEKVYRVFVTGD